MDVQMLHKYLPPVSCQLTVEYAGTDDQRLLELQVHSHSASELMMVVDHRGAVCYATNALGALVVSGHAQPALPLRAASEGATLPVLPSVDALPEAAMQPPSRRLTGHQLFPAAGRCRATRPPSCQRWTWAASCPHPTHSSTGSGSR